MLLAPPCHIQIAVSPALPWEVIERVIGHSAGHPETLRNFSLICRDLRPRALCLMVAEVNIWKRSQIFDFCDFLQAKPHLKPLVRALSVDPQHFAPFPLLRILPNLSTLTLVASSSCRTEGSRAVLNRPVLTSCRLLGVHIQTLHLSKYAFPTYLEFSRVLLAFPNLANLVCKDVVINTKGNQAHLEVLKTRLSERLRLRALTIEFDIINWELPKPHHDSAAASVSRLLLDASLSQPAIESATVQLSGSGVHKISRLPPWPRLQSLMVIVDFRSMQLITYAIALLKDFRHPTLKDMVVKVHGPWDSFFRSDYEGLYADLEQALLKFSRAQIVWVIENLRVGRRSFWTQELGKNFPMLHRRGAFTLTSEGDNDPALLMGHEMPINTLIASSDGKWMASGASDGTIILWDTSNGDIARQWMAHGCTEVESLAFSPDSQHLVSISRRLPNIVIWDLVGDSCAVLEGHTAFVVCCVWSPRGDVIASGSDDNTVRLWDAHTFQQLHVLDAQQLTTRLIKFSPDGRWLVSMYGQGNNHDIWDVASGTLYRSLVRPDNVELDVPFSELIAGSFDPENTRLATAKFDSTRNPATVWDIETGNELLVLGDGGPETTDIAFHPTDGQLVVTASRDGGMKIWDVYTGVQLCSLEGHRDIVSRVLFSPCGTYIASASDDRTVRLWRTRDGSLLATFSEHQVEVRHVAFAGDGKTLWSGALDGTIVTRRMCDIIPTDEQEM